MSKEREIPVFTVWKNNSILKNIFLINNPPDNSDDDYDRNRRHLEETLVVGRHPDCDIRLEHPSISRFHLRIHSFPSQKSLFLTDLSSVHGTWLSGERIEPNIRTKIKEGDSLRIGGSSRVYKLHWIPLSLAYDVSKPYVPPLDFMDQHEDEDEIAKDEISIGLKDEEVKNVNVADDISKGLESLNLSGGDQMAAEKELPQAPQLQPQKPSSVNDEGTEYADISFGGLESPRFGGLSQELEQKEMLLEPLLGHEEIENEEVQSVDSVLEGLVPLFMGENWEWVGQEENYLPCPAEDVNHTRSSEDDETGLASAVLEGLDVPYLDENSELLGQKATLSAPLIPKDVEFPCPTEDDNHLKSSKDDETGLVSPVSKGLNDSELIQKATSSPEDMEFPTTENMDDIAPEGRQESVPEVVGEGVEDNAWSFWCTSQVQPSSSATVGSLSPTECQPLVSPVLKGLDTLPSDEILELLAQRDTESAPSMAGYMDLSASKTMDDITADEKRVHGTVGEDVVDNAWRFWCGSLLAAECHQPGIENESPEALSGKALPKEHSGSELWSFWTGKMGIESVCSALSDSEPFSDSDYKSLPNRYLSSPMISSEHKSACSFWSEREKPENTSCGDCYQSPKSINSVEERLGSPLMTSDQNPMDSIWLRRGKLASAPQVLTSRTEEKKRNTDEKNVKHEPISRALFHGNDDQEEEEVFTPDKENFTPTTHKSMRKFAILKELNNSSSGKSPLFKMSSGPDNHSVDVISPLSDKENYSPGTKEKKKTAKRGSANQSRSVKLKERKGIRMPFQSLLANSPQKSIAECHTDDSETKSAPPVSCANVVACKEKCAREELRQWYMVVDTTTLLNKESRKALQLLEGLKGTQLIIPRIVITELSSLKRQVSFFRRNTEVLSALEWIQDCMLRTGWWIRVQSSVEEGRPVAPTPPASPQNGSYAFSGFECRKEVLSPTVDDDVLDFALNFKKNNHDGRLVLLSNDITTKIKAMAEAMICETGEEFRESLVNPFSERFRWTDSSPRGRTWSCADDFVLKERFYPSSLKMMTPKSRENVKGLKLILQHNSRYYEQMTTAR
ncbi:hypothetical protein vseg_019145 [Gypsophila vaccaria]